MLGGSQKRVVKMAMIRCVSTPLLLLGQFRRGFDFDAKVVDARGIFQLIGGY